MEGDWYFEVCFVCLFSLNEVGKLNMVYCWVYERDLEDTLRLCRRCFESTSR